MSLKQPVTQKRLTNVAVVRLRSHGFKFEIACYKNKIVNWREGVEKELDEVLQTTSIFTNVSQGVLAKEKELKLAFPGMSGIDICKHILVSGKEQISEKEREVNLESLKNEILTFVARRCINPETGRPLTIGLAESALRQAGYVIKPGMVAKRQALLAIAQICKMIPNLVAKANMRLCLRFPHGELPGMRERISTICASSTSLKFEGADVVVEDDDGCLWSELCFVCDPFHFRELDKAGGQLRVLDAQVARSGDANMDDEQFLLDEEVDAVVVEEWGGKEGLPLGVGAPLTAGTTPKSCGSFLMCDDTPSQTKADWLMLTPQKAAGSGESSATGGGACSSPTPDANADQKMVPPTGVCTTCGDYTEENIRAHMKSEWHQYNVQRKCDVLPPLSAMEFREYQLDKDFMQGKDGEDGPSGGGGNKKNKKKKK